MKKIMKEVVLLMTLCTVSTISYTQSTQKDSVLSKGRLVTKEQMIAILKSLDGTTYNTDSLIRLNTPEHSQKSNITKVIQVDSCERKFIKSIFNDIYNGKEEWIVIKVINWDITWEEIVSSRLFYDVYLNPFRKSYRDTAIKNYNAFMFSTEARYFPNNSFDAENTKFNEFKKRYKKDTLQYNKLSKQGLQVVLKKYFDKKQQLLDKYKPIQMQIFWYLFDNRIRVVTPQKGKSYYILYDCATTFFPKASYAAYF